MTSVSLMFELEKKDIFSFLSRKINGKAPDPKTQLSEEEKEEERQ